MSAAAVIRTAERELGYTESPPNSNRTKYGAAYGLDGYSWCVMFLWWCFRDSGESAAFYGGGKTASCGQLMRFYQGLGRWVKDDYIPGDIVIMNFSGTRDTEHCGIVVQSNPDWTVYTIEGNTTPGLEGSQDNGGSVARKLRYPGNIIGACRPDYRADLPIDVSYDHWAADAIRWAITMELMQGFPDGTFRPDEPVTRAQVAQVMKKMADKQK